MPRPAVKDQIQAAARERLAIRRRFGFTPFSVVRIKRGALSRSMFILQRERPELSPGEDATKKRLADGTAAPREQEYFKLTGETPRQVIFPAGALSVMPAEMVDFFVQFYAAPGQVYLDPFMGQGIQMQVAKLRGLHYYGLDCCQEFVAYIEAVRAKIDDGTTTLKPILGDSLHPYQIADGIGDFGFTSPPYWDVEEYGPEPEQGGNAQTYEAFLEWMQAVAAAWLPKFKPGAYLVVNVNDFRRGGRFYPYHADCIGAFTRAGWAPSDLWIIQGSVGALSHLFARGLIQKRIAPKAHEYGLVFQRP